MVTESTEPAGHSEIPDIPPAIIEAASAGRLVLFVGAGVSRLAGGPSWSRSAENALEEIVEKRLIPFAEAEQLRKEHPKKKLSIAMDISQNAGSVLDFDRIFSPPENQLDAQIYRDLYSIGVPIVTTNYDKGLDYQALREAPVAGSVQALSGAGPQNVAIPPKQKGVVYIEKKDLTIEKLQQPGLVIHLHGSIHDHKTMVVSTRQYITHYRDDLVQVFLGKLFEGDYTVLFVGYGLEEEEILEYVTQKSQTSLKLDAQEIKHFWLYPHLGFQEARFRHLSNYYRNHCNVRLEKFSIDRAGYIQLADVIAEWTEVLRRKVRAPEFLDKVRLIDKVT
ncbi:MAG: hypothetical protein EWM72_03470 [Nitrospira sp.]|nr:MAG: hypothetical protein EWM72_03470 [Nitrospira sp.]